MDTVVSVFKTKIKAPTYTDIPEREYNVKHILDKYPERIPVYVRISDHLPEMDKQKFLVPHDLTVGQFIYVCRKRIKLAPEQGLFIFFGGVIPSTAASLKNIYDQYKEKDGLLVATLAAENTFGDD